MPRTPAMEKNLAAGCREFRPTRVIAMVMDVTAGVFWNLVKPGRSSNWLGEMAAELPPEIT